MRYGLLYSVRLRFLAAVVVVVVVGDFGDFAPRHPTGQVFTGPRKVPRGVTALV